MRLPLSPLAPFRRPHFVSGGISSPLDISGCGLWLDGSDASTLYDATSGGSLVAAGGTVARWEDKSGSARHATQGTAGDRPTRQTAVQNGKDVLRFDGTSDYFGVAATTITNNVSGVTLFLVAKCTNTTTVSQAGGVYFASNAAGTRAAIFANPTTANTVSYGGRRLDADALDRNDLSVTHGGTFHVWSAVLNYSAATKQVYQDGTLGNNDTSFQTAGNTSATNSSVVNVGAVNATTFWPGDICEVVVYDRALNGTERAQVEAYLKAKWGTP